MANDVILNKAASIERCIKRVQDEYTKAGSDFATDYSRQDAAILNIQRACEATLDAGHHIIRNQKLGIPQSARDVFTLIEKAHIIPAELADNLKKMVGFRNIAVHDYQALLLPIVVNIIENHLIDFDKFAKILLKL